MLDNRPTPDYDIRAAYLDHRTPGLVEQNDPGAALLASEPLVHGNVVERVVITGQQYHRPLCPIELLGRPGKEFLGDPAVVKEVACDEQRVDFGVHGEVDNPLESELF